MRYGIYWRVPGRAGSFLLTTAPLIIVRAGQSSFFRLYLVFFHPTGLRLVGLIGERDSRRTLELWL